MCVCVCVWMTYIGLPWLHQSSHVLCGYSYTHAHTHTLCRVVCFCVCFAMVTTACTSEEIRVCMCISQNLLVVVTMNAWSKVVTVTCKYIIVAGSTMVRACHVLELTIGWIWLWWLVTLTDSLVYWWAKNVWNNYNAGVSCDHGIACSDITWGWCVIKLGQIWPRALHNAGTMEYIYCIYMLAGVCMEFPSAVMSFHTKLPLP